MPGPEAGRRHHAGASASSKLPKASTARRWPGRTTTLVSGVSTMAGPATALPGSSALAVDRPAVASRRRSSSQ